MEAKVISIVRWKWRSILTYQILHMGIAIRKIKAKMKKKDTVAHYTNRSWYSAEAPVQWDQASEYKHIHQYQVVW